MIYCSTCGKISHTDTCETCFEYSMRYINPKRAPNIPGTKNPDKYRNELFENLRLFAGLAAIAVGFTVLIWRFIL